MLAEEAALETLLEATFAFPQMFSMKPEGFPGITVPTAEETDRLTCDASEAALSDNERFEEGP